MSTPSSSHDHRGPPYSLEDDKRILRYILDGNHHDVVGGNAIWVKMEKENVVQARSWQSLKNRFKRNILVDCSRPEYGLSQDEKLLLRALNRPHNTRIKTPARNVQPPIINKFEEDKSNEVQENRNKDLYSDKCTRSVQSSLEGNTQQECTRDTSEAVPRGPSAKIRGMTNEQKLSSKQSEFYSLNMEWSDSD